MYKKFMGLSGRLQLIYFVLFVQLFYSLAIYPITGRRDFFPLHSWTLFDKVYKERSLPTIFIYQWDDHVYQNERSFYDFFKGNLEVDFLLSHDYLTFGYFKNDSTKKEKEIIRREIERHFFKDANYVEYDIQMLLVDGYEFYRSGAVKEVLSKSKRFRYERTGN